MADKTGEKDLQVAANISVSGWLFENREESWTTMYQEVAWVRELESPATFVPYSVRRDLSRIKPLIHDYIHVQTYYALTSEKIWHVNDCLPLYVTVDNFEQKWLDTELSSSMIRLIALLLYYRVVKLVTFMFTDTVGMFDRFVTEIERISGRHLIVRDEQLVLSLTKRTNGLLSGVKQIVYLGWMDRRFQQQNSQECIHLITWLENRICHADVLKEFEALLKVTVDSNLLPSNNTIQLRTEIEQRLMPVQRLARVLTLAEMFLDTHQDLVKKTMLRVTIASNHGWWKTIAKQKGDNERYTVIIQRTSIEYLEGRYYDILVDYAPVAWMLCLTIRTD